MNTVTLSVASREDVARRALAAFEGEPQGAHISFASAELLWKTLTRKRWELLKAMTGQGAMSIRETARRVGRDVKAVHGDVRALLDAGVLDRTSEGFVFPYDAVHVDFMLNSDPNTMITLSHVIDRFGRSHKVDLHADPITNGFDISVGSNYVGSITLIEGRAVFDPPLSGTTRTDGLVTEADLRVWLGWYPGRATVSGR